MNKFKGEQLLFETASQEKITVIDTIDGPIFTFWSALGDEYMILSYMEAFKIVTALFVKINAFQLSIGESEAEND
jgi:hypothetical protein